VTDWPSMSLRDLARRPRTWSPAANASGKPFVYVDLGAIDQDTKEIVGAREVQRKEAPSRARQILAAGDVLVSTVRPNLNAVARVPRQLDGATASTGFCVLRPDEGKLDGNYLFQWVRTSQFVTSMVERATGASYPAVSDKIVLDSRLPVPPLSEQRRIAAVLDRADVLRVMRRAAVAHLDALTQSIFLELFGDPRSNERGWPICGMGEVLKDFRGGANLKPDDFVNSGFPILHKGAIKPNGDVVLDQKKKTFATEHYASANRQSQVDRTFLAVTLRDLVPSGPSIGMVADLHSGPFDNYLLVQGVGGFRPVSRAVRPEYLVALSNMPSFRHVLRQYAVGTTQIHIRNPIYLKIPIPLPPLAVQDRFVELSQAVREQRRLAAASLSEMDALFCSIQYRSFRSVP
jgi:type I restriction enzyme, S subunit